MTNSGVPKLNREIPGLRKALLPVLMNGLLRPLNAILTVGDGAPLILRKGNRFKSSQDKIKAAFDGYNPESHDIFINSYAKSGTNWMMQIAYQTAFLGDGEFANIHDVIPWPDCHVPFLKKYIIPLSDKRALKASPTNRRVIKTHLAAQYVPFNDKSCYLTVIRDPKDVFVSSYHFQAGILGPLMPDVDKWLESFLTLDFPIGYGATWAEHTASYWSLRDKPNVKIFSYAEMKIKLTETVKQVADCLNIDLTKDQLEKVVTKSSFEYMKKINDRFFPVDTSFLSWSDVKLLRSGKEGSSGELLSAEQQRYIDETCQTQLRLLGSDFPYHKYCRVV